MVVVVSTSVGGGVAVVVSTTVGGGVLVGVLSNVDSEDGAAV